MKRITKAITAVLIFAVGWIVGLIASDLSWFQYDNSFSIFDLLYAVISVGVAIYIAHVIENGLQNKRGQKDLIIKRIEEVDNAINDVLSSFNCESGKYQISNSKLLSQAKQIGMKYKRIESSIKKYYPEYATTEAFKNTAINTFTSLITGSVSRIKATVSLLERTPTGPTPNAFDCSSSHTAASWKEHLPFRRMARSMTLPPVPVA